MALITITADLPGNARVQVTADQVSAHFAIAPQLLVIDGGEVRYGEHCSFLLIHIPGGRPITETGDGVDLRQFAVLLEALPIDWDLTDPSGPCLQHIEQIHGAIELASDDHAVTVYA